jgi:hypothetical protein
MRSPPARARARGRGPAAGAGAVWDEATRLTSSTAALATHARQARPTRPTIPEDANASGRPIDRSIIFAAHEGPTKCAPSWVPLPRRPLAACCGAAS